MHKMIWQFYLNGMLFVPFVTFNQAQHIIAEYLGCYKALRVNKMGLVRAATLYTSRGTNHPELHNSMALNLSSALRSHVLTAINVRQDYQQKGTNYQKREKGWGGRGEGDEGWRGRKGRREREREKEGSRERRKARQGEEGRERKRARELNHTGEIQDRTKRNNGSLKWALKNRQNFSTGNDGNNSNDSSCR